MSNLDEVNSLLPEKAFSRRGFVQTAVGTGFAAAVMPISAQTITTPDTGLLAGEVTIPVGNFKMPAYRAQPAGKKDLPVILVVSEIFGVHAHIADVCRRFAQEGYLAIAPELQIRQGDAKSYTEITKLISEVISKVPDEQVMKDLDATAAWAAKHGGDLQHLGITGFCWGGRITWLYAAHNPAVRAGVAWYGRLVGNPNPLQPKNPVDIAAKLNGPVLGLYGAADTGIPLDSVQKMQEALKSGTAGSRLSDFVVYPDTPHAFHADYRPSYRKEAAQDGWRRCLAWFKKRGV